MQTTFEKLGGTSQQMGDYLLPNIDAPESPQIGIWGKRRLKYLRTNKRVLYTTMLIGGTLNDHLEEVDKSAMDSKSWISFWKDYPWMITMLFGTSAANFVPLTNTTHL